VGLTALFVMVCINFFVAYHPCQGKGLKFALEDSVSKSELFTLGVGVTKTVDVVCLTPSLRIFNDVGKGSLRIFKEGKNLQRITSKIVERLSKNGTFRWSCSPKSYLFFIFIF
jgi:hypothetical protein